MDLTKEDLKKYLEFYKININDIKFNFKYDFTFERKLEYLLDFLNRLDVILDIRRLHNYCLINKINNEVIFSNFTDNNYIILEYNIIKKTLRNFKIDKICET